MTAEDAQKLHDPARMVTAGCGASDTTDAGTSSNIVMVMEGRGKNLRQHEMSSARDGARRASRAYMSAGMRPAAKEHAARAARAARAGRWQGREA